uniref:Neprosin PEP catalytic domain-containing protein n=1 Tax=Kalanchoe fedtschenkoi TaxID=63787 RepID=A0A7N0TXN6_KALFE
MAAAAGGWKTMIALCFLVLVSPSLQSQTPRHVRNHLKKLNKRPVKSIKSPDGDVIDCVPVEKQLAFDHPLLLNHKIQMKPTVHPQGLFEDIKAATSSSPDLKTGSIKQLWHKNGRCPQGTIPVRRATIGDVMRADKVEHYGMKKKHLPRPLSADLGFIQTGHEHAIAYVEGGKYYGAKATMNVWKPQIQDTNEFSLSQIWVLGGTFDLDLNSIEAGWQVSPDLYGDNNTRLFTYWTGDTYQATGCYNLLCSGFVQLNSDIALGASIYPVSNYDDSQYDISILIWKDQSEGHWWMQFGADHVIGYWPSFLFSLLTDSASMIEWGGEVVNSAADGQHTTTQMGSGHFPNEGFGKASYFRNIQVVDESNNLRNPKDVGTYTEKSNCYSVQTGNNGKWGSYFYYGGPGRNPDCP